MAALGVYTAYLDEIAETARFVRLAAELRPRFGAVLDWNALGALQQPVQAFLGCGPIETRVLQAFLVVAHAGLEQFVLSLVEDACQLVNERALPSAEVERRIPGLLKRFQRACGLALGHVFEPRDHWNLDYDKLLVDLGSTHTTSGAARVLGKSFVAVGRSADSKGVSALLENVGFTLSWDDIGRDREIQRLLGRSGVRETARAAETLLDALCRKRNALAHSQGSLALSQSEFDTYLSFYREFARHIDGAVTAHVRQQIA